MSSNKVLRLRDTELAATNTQPVLVPPAARIDIARRHVINRAMQEKSGRLYCNDDWDFEIPSLELYAAR